MNSIKNLIKEDHTFEIPSYLNKERKKIDRMVFLLLGNICMIEKIADVDILLDYIRVNKRPSVTLRHAATLFTAVYYAEASTLIGHLAAQHGEGLKTIDDTMKVMHRKYCDYYSERLHQACNVLR